MTVARALRSLRRPFVSLCTALLIANLLIPVASFAGSAEANAFCHGAATGQDTGGADGSHHHAFQSCCFSAAVALSPGPVALPALCTGSPQAAPLPLATRLLPARQPGARQIRAPPAI
ncbi:hypothetical protein RDV64_02210 [Acuticoccus sp. MNP-M23]|uniref:DUF2946 family protein n=1 Tax=Acuticoccus sp. MNP-M23 TaxID=3072793 RepID=UPI0028151725|nr:DUF2946 family protein [Acuticoccus sp. MNP-M23]WMS43237.1 hypothetical protein RDV64_02210 [Acuticoccus sp. MNP-M23]